MDPDTPTKELDSILQDLMGMGEGAGVSTLPPIVCPKMTETSG